MNNTWRAYKNGNYIVRINLADGTKIRFNNSDSFVADRPESMDVKISNACDMGCPMCHEQSVPGGALADLNHPIFDSIPYACELALGGGNVLEHPGLELFLKRMATRGVICNITVHLHHFLMDYEYIKSLNERGLVHGIGVSINENIYEETVAYLKGIPNVVVHVIAGIVPWKTLVNLSNHGIKLLILGYKTYGRGETYIKNHDVRAQIDILKNRIGYLYKHFKVVSFDNLALEQLDIKNTVDENTWNKCYLGEDGTATYYIDACKMEYAKSSTSPRHPIDVDNVVTLFRRVRDGEV